MLLKTSFRIAIVPSVCVERREAVVKIIKNISDCAFPSSINGSSNLVLSSLHMLFRH